MDGVDDRWVRVGGLLVAVLGFAITRLFVAGAVGEVMPRSFLVSAGPLAVGLGLTVYGVVLAIGVFSRTYVNTVARWCLAGTAAMLVVLVVTSADALLAGRGFRPFRRSPTLVANVLLAGAVGGVLIGARVGTIKRQRREIRRQSNEALLLNRLLRHEVLNAVAIIGGHVAELDRTGEVRDRSVRAISDAADRIDETIETVADLISDGDGDRWTDLSARAAAAVETVRTEYPGVRVDLDCPPDPPAATGDERLEQALLELLHNAAADDETDRIRVSVGASSRGVTVTVSDDGSGLPAEQRALLQSGSFPEYDDPSVGFGLQIVRLLAMRWDARVQVAGGIDGTGTAVSITLPRADVTSRAIDVTVPDIARATTAGLAAGVAMGGFFAVETDVLPVIGALYGVSNPVVGWLTHLFHSVVFALLFAAACSHPAIRQSGPKPVRSGAIGVAWGVLLWLVAAGLIMPLWLRGVGVPAMLPNLPTIGLASHVLWGAVLGVGYALLGRADLSPLGRGRGG